MAYMVNSDRNEARYLPTHQNPNRNPFDSTNVRNVNANLDSLRTIPMAQYAFFFFIILLD